MEYLKAIARFWRHVDKSGAEPTHVPGIGGCWNWTAFISNNGYGKFGADWRKPDYAHRFSWQFHFGSPGPMQVLHRCDNRRCVRPDHLFLGTHQDNMDDMAAKGRRRSHGLPGEKNPRAKISASDATQIRSLYASGAYSQVRLGELFGIGRCEVGRVVRGLNWGNVGSGTGRHLYRRGSAMVGSKLNESSIPIIRERLATGKTCRAVADEFGVTPGLISQVGRRKIWRHVP